ncbi:TPA: Rne/Rng family ribonuclease [Candidatus Galligastranaerophilus faecipullorum]|nr:Rne/Rng family ribonuclease [Candidatus Galligastranaerophilus faecipullorum]
MSKKIVISEKDNIAALIENNKVNEFFVSKGDVLMGDVYLARVDNVLPSIEAAFLDVGMSDKMAFIHANDISGKGPLKEKVKPNQKLIVQVVKEPTGHKGPRVTTALSLPGRFLVLLPDETGVNVSRKIVSNKERARLKSIVSLLKPVGVGVIVRTEAEGQSEAEIQEDIEILLEKWNSIVTAADTANPPCLLYRDQDLLYRVIREACTEDVEEIIVDTPFALHRTTQLLQHWNMNVKVNMHKGNDPLLVATGVNKEIHAALQTKVNLPLGGYLFIQQTEALTVVDVNSGKFTSSSSQAETILKTNLQAADEIARQLKLRNIGGMVVVDFIDMVSRMDKLAVLEHFELALEQDKAKPQIGQLSDLGLVELTRHRQGQSLSEIFTKKCDKCNGQGFVMEDLKFQTSNAQGESRAKMNKIKGPFAANFTNEGKPNVSNGQNSQKFNKKDKRNRFNKDKDFNKQQEETQTPAALQQVLPGTSDEPVINEAQIFEPVDTPEQTAVQEAAEVQETADIQTAEEKPKKVSRKTKKSQKKEALKAQDDSAALQVNALEIQQSAEEDSAAKPEEAQETAAPAKKRTVRRTRKAKNA